MLINTFKMLSNFYQKQTNISFMLIHCCIHNVYILFYINSRMCRPILFCVEFAMEVFPQYRVYFV